MSAVALDPSGEPTEDLDGDINTFRDLEQVVEGRLVEVRPGSLRPCAICLQGHRWQDSWRL